MDLSIVAKLIKSTRDHLDSLGAPPKETVKKGQPIFDRRDDEQPYALLNDKETAKENRYGNKIDLLEITDAAIPLKADRSMFINENPAVGENPNRNKQHGFHFTADNCIGCHACEAACSEKNGNPAHISFRSVGYVEGGTYPDYKRMNISMACNHCDDPVCLKGCPTKAYTKHAEYGAVLQDPETCFGCGYCTWVCPYNAPQLDPIEGQVSKCNMCVDRLEEGLKPACVSACLGNALNFGVVENAPENREQTLNTIPGFPDPTITQPNIRFQQTRSMPNEVTRTDSMPVKYHKTENEGFKSVVDQKEGQARHWNLQRLSSRENPLVIFTLFTQAVIGAFSALFLGSVFGIESIVQFKESALFFPLLLVLVGMQTGALVLSTVHLGKPLRFYRGFNNLHYSPLSREALGVAMFFAGMAGYTFFSAVDWMWDLWLARSLAFLAGTFAVASGLVGVYYMTRIYRIKARPFWNHWQVSTTFFGSMCSMGGLLLAIFAVPGMLLAGSEVSGLMLGVGVMIGLGLMAELIGLACHARDMNVEAGEGAASHYIQTTTFGKTYWLRNGLLAFSLLIAAALFLFQPASAGSLVLLSIMALAMIPACFMGRALFYVLVIPTTMPGAFFWKNKGFEQHARDIGLANMPQVGVVPDLH